MELGTQYARVVIVIQATIGRSNCRSQ